MCKNGHKCLYCTKWVAFRGARFTLFPNKSSFSTKPSTSYNYNSQFQFRFSPALMDRLGNVGLYFYPWNFSPCKSSRPLVVNDLKALKPIDQKTVKPRKRTFSRNEDNCKTFTRIIKYTRHWSTKSALIYSSFAHLTWLKPYTKKCCYYTFMNEDERVILLKKPLNL